MQFQRVLAASALRDPPDAAVINAGILAAVTGAELHVFHAVEPSSGADYERRDAVRQQLAMRAPEALSAAVGAGKAYQAISDHAATLGADVIVLGSRARSAQAGLLGNTADRIIRTARLPCMLSSGSLPPDPSRVLVALDGSQHARRAIRVAEAFATAVSLQGVIAPVAIHLLTVSAFAAPGRNLQREFVDLAPIAARLVSRTQGIAVEVSHSVRSAPLAGEGIVEFSEEFRPDLVVMGTHGVGRMMRALVGSVALDVARALPRPLVLVPPPARRQNQP